MYTAVFKQCMVTAAAASTDAGTNTSKRANSAYQRLHSRPHGDGVSASAPHAGPASPPAPYSPVQPFFHFGDTTT